jgi:hypothetical protein
MSCVSEYDFLKTLIEIEKEKIIEENKLEVERKRREQIARNTCQLEIEIYKFSVKNQKLSDQIFNLQRQLDFERTQLNEKYMAKYREERDKLQNILQEIERHLIEAIAMDNLRKEREIQREQKRYMLEQKQKEVDALRIQKHMRELRHKKHEQQRLAELRQLIRQTEIKREQLRAMRALNEAEKQQNEIDAAAISLQDQIERMQILQRQVVRMEARIAEEENLVLDVSKPDWNKTFVLEMVTTKMVVSVAEGVGDLTKVPATTFESNASFLNFTKDGPTFRGTLRPIPFARGTFRYAYYARSETGERFVAKHMIDFYNLEEDEATDLKETAAVHFLGKKIVEEFNKAKPPTAPQFEMVSCDVMEWTSRPTSLQKVVVIFNLSDENLIFFQTGWEANTKILVC